MVELAAMIAIIIIMAFTPLGYIKLPGLTITFLTIPVAVGAIILGPVGGLICGQPCIHYYSYSCSKNT